MVGGPDRGCRVMGTLVCLGFGYCARHYVTHFGDRFTRVVGTTRTAGNAAVLSAEAFGNSRVDMLVFDGAPASPDVAAAVNEADALLISAAPGEAGDPVLAALGHHIAAARGLRSVVVLSTLGVYSDSAGAWIDETAPVVPERARRGRARIDAERAWQALGAQRGVPVAILRLGGIYGPGQNGMRRVLRGVAHRVAKPGHVSNRIHVFDIAQAIDAALARRVDGIFNIVDDEPASPSAQVAYAAELLGIAPPPEIPCAEAAKVLTPFALSFYDGCIRARNDKLKAELGVTLRYPNYRDGLRALYAAGDHLADGGDA
jgi:nucleoside-diphosphate-sugar epimerase